MILFNLLILEVWLVTLYLMQPLPELDYEIP